MRDFEVATEVDHTSLSHTELQNASSFRCVHRWKGSTIKVRLGIRGYNHHVQDEDPVFASTPSRSSLKLVLTLSLAYNWSIHMFDITTAFLRAPLHEQLYAWGSIRVLPRRKNPVEYTQRRLRAEDITTVLAIPFLVYTRECRIHTAKFRTEHLQSQHTQCLPVCLRR